MGFIPRKRPKKEKTPPLPPLPATPGALHSLVYDRTRIEVVAADATRFPIQAIVNAANASLRGGSGINGAIQKAAGPGLLDELTQLYPNGGADGKAYPTGAHNIQTTQNIIHAVGPDYRAYREQGQEAAARAALFDAYQNSMEGAQAKGITSIAFPTLSTGIFGFPREEACQIAMAAVRQFLDQQETYQFERVVFLVWQPQEGDSPDLVHYNANFAESWAAPENLTDYGNNDVEMKDAQEDNGESSNAQNDNVRNGNEQNDHRQNDNGQTGNGQNGNGQSGSGQGGNGNDNNGQNNNKEGGADSEDEEGEEPVVKKDPVNDGGVENEPVDEEEVDPEPRLQDIPEWPGAQVEEQPAEEEPVQDPNEKDPVEEEEPVEEELVAPAPPGPAPAAAPGGTPIAGSCGADGGQTKARTWCKRAPGRNSTRCHQHPR